MAANTLFADIVNQNFLYPQYEAGADYLYNNDTNTFALFDRGEEMVMAKTARGTKCLWNVITGRSPSTDSVGDGDALPRGALTPDEVAEENLTYAAAGIRISAAEMEAAMTPGDGAFIATLDQKVPAAVNGLAKLANWQIFARKRGGLCQLAAGATFTAAAAGVEVNVDNQATDLIQLLVGAGVDVQGTEYAKTFRIVANPGAAADSDKGKVMLASSPTDGGKLKLTRVGSTNVVGADNDWVMGTNYKVGPNNTTAGYSEALVPLTDLISESGVVHGIDPATVPTWASYVGAVGALTENVFDTPVNRIQERSGRPRRLLAIADLDAITDYTNVFFPDKRWVNTTDFTGGGSVPTALVRDIPVTFRDDIDAASEEVLLVNPDDLGYLRGKGIAFLRGPGGVQWQQVTNSDGDVLAQFRTQLILRHALIVKRRNAHAKLTSF